MEYAKSLEALRKEMGTYKGNANFLYEYPFVVFIFNCFFLHILKYNIWPFFTQFLVSRKKTVSSSFCLNGMKIFALNYTYLVVSLNETSIGLFTV